MSFVRRLSAALCALALAVLAAAPAEAMRCRASGACPMMAKKSAPCHATGGRPADLSAPMDCCRERAIAPVAPTLPGLDPAPVGIPAAIAAATPAPQLFPAVPLLDRPAVALFTLHAVWRI